MKYDYDLTVIGGGSAGLTAAGMGANFGAKTLLVEADRLGGDCTWYGCIPSKTLLNVSKTADAIRKAEKFGYKSAQMLDFSAVMEHVRSVRREVYEEADKPEIYRDMGVDVEFGIASFSDPHTLLICKDDEQNTVTSRYFIIATGSSARVPQIEGLNTVSYHTTETIFEIREQPGSLIVLGGGPVGIELAQAFQRLGTQVTVLEAKSGILTKDDKELSDQLYNRLSGEGIEFHLSVMAEEVFQDGSDVRVQAKKNDQTVNWSADALLIASGRVPTCNGLALESAGVKYSNEGIAVNERCRTNISHIFAAGDVTGRYNFTHMSEHMAKVAVTNALLKYPLKTDNNHVPWCTYTDPELAHVGFSEEELKQDNVSYETYRLPFSKIDRAATEDATSGLIKIFARKVSGKVLGVSILGKHAGDMIGEYALAMRNGISLREISDTIHPYPTYGLGVRRAADQWYVKNQSEWMVKLIKWIFGYRGTVPDLSDKERIL